MECPNVTVSANPATIAASGGTSSISAAATRTRTWTWNGVSGSGGTETDRATPSLSAAGSGFSLSGTTLTAGNNTTASERSCTVTATSNGRSAACTVRQSAGSQTTEYGNWTTGSLSVSASPSGIGSSGGTSRLSATASQSRPKYTKWNGITTGTTTEYRSVDVSSSASWSGSASGFSRSGTTVTVAANGSTSSRNCTYTASYGGKSGHVTIHQDGKPADVITYGYIFTLGAVSGDDVVSTGEPSPTVSPHRRSHTPTAAKPPAAISAGRLPPTCPGSVPAQTRQPSVKTRQLPTVAARLR